jgi:hypothetical protein
MEVGLTLLTVPPGVPYKETWRADVTVGDKKHAAIGESHVAALIHLVEYLAREVFRLQMICDRGRDEEG